MMDLYVRFGLSNFQMWSKTYLESSSVVDSSWNIGIIWSSWWPTGTLH